jgi:transposase InsO family protein
VNRQFTVDRPDALWVGDVTEHPTAEGKVYLATVIDAFSRRVVGWSIADHLRAELVVDALQMAIWRRDRREAGTVMHTDHGSQPRFKGSSQHLVMEVERHGCWQPSAGDPSDSYDAWPDVLTGSATSCTA